MEPEHPRCPARLKKSPPGLMRSQVLLGPYGSLGSYDTLEVITLEVIMGPHRLTGPHGSSGPSGAL